MMESSETNETTAMEQSAEINAEVRQNEPTQPQATDTVAAETAVSEPTESQEVAVEETAAESEATPTANIYKTKEEVVARARQIVETGEASDKQELDLLKQLFYKFHNAEAVKAREEHFAAGGT